MKTQEQIITRLIELLKKENRTPDDWHEIHHIIWSLE